MLCYDVYGCSLGGEVRSKFPTTWDNKASPESYNIKQLQYHQIHLQTKKRAEILTEVHVRIKRRGLTCS